MPAAPPKVTPSLLNYYSTGNVFNGQPVDVTHAFRYFTGAISYWLPDGLNKAMGAAKMARTFK